MELHKESGVEIFNLYICSFDGEKLEKYTYLKGIKTDVVLNIQPNTNDPDIFTLRFHIETLGLKYDITNFYNNDYKYDYCDCN